MSPQEQQALDTFLTQLTQARAGAKDPQAEARIAQAVAQQPDAAYLLVQRAMLLDQALVSAQAQIASLQNQLQAAQAGQAPRNTAFLDSANNWGSHGNAAAPNPGYPPQQQAAPMPPMPAPAQPAPAQPASPGFLGGGLGSTLGGIASTAAGVAGGAFLFQGIENLFHHNSGGGFLGGQQPMLGSPSETVVNNIYEGDKGRASNADTSSSDDQLLDTDDIDSDDSDDDLV